ncbi:MAG: peptidoglycan-binding protein [Candidatus Omnitrophota bacterium]
MDTTNPLLYRLPEGVFTNFLYTEKLPDGFERRVIDLAQVSPGIAMSRTPLQAGQISQVLQGFSEKIAKTEMPDTQKAPSALEQLFGRPIEEGDSYSLLVKKGKVFAIALENKQANTLMAIPTKVQVEGAIPVEADLKADLAGYQQAAAKAEQKGVAKLVKEKKQAEPSRLTLGARHPGLRWVLPLFYLVMGIGMPLTAVFAAPVVSTPSVLDYTDLNLSASEFTELTGITLVEGLPPAFTEFAEDPIQAEVVDFSDHPILAYGSEGNFVGDVQEMLSSVVSFGELPNLLKGTGVDVENLKTSWKVDNHYGWKTEAYVYAFQIKFGLTPDGDVGPQTWAKLYETAIDQSLKSVESAQGTGVEPPMYASLDADPAAYATGLGAAVTVAPEPLTPVATVAQVEQPSAEQPAKVEATVSQQEAIPAQKAALPVAREDATLADQMKTLGGRTAISAIFWDPSHIDDPASFFTLVGQNGITEIFLDAGELMRGDITLDEMVKVIQEARSHGVEKVRLIAGDPSWAYQADEAYSFFDGLLAKVHDLAAKGAAIDGFSVDIEPHALAEQWNNDLSGYVAVRDALQEKAAQENLDVVVMEPFWYSQKILEGGRELVGYKPYQGTVGIMSYRDHAMGADGIVDLSKETASLEKHMVGIETMPPQPGIPDKLTFFGEEERIPGELGKVIAHSQAERPTFQGVFIHFKGVGEAERILREWAGVPKPRPVTLTPHLLGRYDYAAGTFEAQPRNIGIDPSFETNLEPVVKRGFSEEVLKFIGDVAGNAWEETKHLWGKVFPSDTSLETVKTWKGNLFGDQLPNTVGKAVVLWDPEEIPREQIPQYLEAEARNGTNVVLYGTAKLLLEEDHDLRKSYRSNAFFFLEEAHKRGIQVHSLQGDPSWILSPDKAIGYFNALEGIAVGGQTLGFDKHVFDIEPDIPLREPSDRVERDYYRDVVENYPETILRIQQVVGEQFVNFVDPSYVTLPNYRQTAASEIIMAYDVTPQGILDLVTKSHIAGRPYTVAVEAGHAVGEFKDFHTREDQIRPILEAVNEALQNDPDFRGFVVHFANTGDRRDVLEKDHLTTGDVVAEQVGNFVAGRKPEAVRAGQYLVGEVRPTRYGMYESAPSPVWNTFRLRIQAILGGVFGLDAPADLRVPLGGEPGVMTWVTKTLWGFQYTPQAHIKGVSVTLVDENKNPVGEGYQQSSLIGAEEEFLVPKPNHYARFDITVAKDPSWQEFSGNVVVAMQHRSELVPDEFYSEGVSLRQEGETHVTVYVPINKWGLHLPKVILTTEAQTETEQIVDAVGGPDVEAALKWAIGVEDENGEFQGGHQNEFPEFVHQNREMFLQRGYVLEKDYEEKVGKLSNEELVRYLDALDFQKLERLIVKKQETLEPIDRIALHWMKIREFPAFKVGADRVDAEVAPSAAAYRVGEDVLLPLDLINEGTRPVSHYMTHLFLRNTTKGVELPLTGEKQQVWVNGAEYTGWIEGNKIILEPVGGKFTRDVVLGGDWISTKGKLQPNITFGRKGFEVEGQAFESRTEGDRLVLVKTHDIKISPSGREVLVPNGKLAESVTIFDERFLRVPVSLKQGEALQGILNLGKLPPGSYYVNGYMVSSDETFLRNLSVQFQVGTPKLELSPVKTGTDLITHSPAKPYLETEVTNTGDAPITVYPVAAFMDKQTGEEVSTELPKDVYEAHFILPDGTTQEILTIQPGETVSVKVKLEINPDPLTDVKDEVLSLRRQAKGIVAATDIEQARADARTILSKAAALAQQARQSRGADLEEHYRRNMTDDLRLVVADMENGIQSLSVQLKALRAFEGEEPLVPEEPEVKKEAEVPKEAPASAETPLIEGFSSETPLQAIFWDPWNIQNPDQFFKQLRQTGVTEIFLDGYKFLTGQMSAQKMTDIVQAAHANGVQKIRLIMGDPSWAFDRKGEGIQLFKDLITKVGEMEKQGAKIDGFGLDVEPHTSPQWGSPSQPFDFATYNEFRDAVSQMADDAGLDVIPFVSFWYGLSRLEDGKQLLNFKPYSGVTAIMSYRDSPYSMMDVLKFRGALAGSFIFGAETDNISPQQTTFYGETDKLPKVMSQVAAGMASDPNFRGGFIHFGKAAHLQELISLIGKKGAAPEDTAKPARRVTFKEPRAPVVSWSEELQRTASVDAVASLVLEALGDLSVALNEASNGMYGVRLSLIDVAADKTKNVYLGDQGVLARTDHLVYEVNTDGSIQRKVENYVDIQEQTRQAQAGLDELKATVERQTLGLERQKAELAKASGGEWVAPLLQGVNQIASGLTQETYVLETDQLLEKAFREELGEDIWKMRGGFERKSWPHFFRTVRPLAKLFTHQTSYEDIEGEQIRRLSDPNAYNALEQRAMDRLQAQLEATGATGHLSYLALVRLQRQLVALDETVNDIYQEYDGKYGTTTPTQEADRIPAFQLANQSAGEALQQNGGISGLFQSIKQTLNHYLAAKGLSYQVEGDIPEAVIGSMKMIQAAIPEDAVFGSFVPFLSDQMERVEQKNQELARTEKFTGELQTFDIPAAEAHLAALGNDLGRAERDLVYAVKLLPQEERETFLVRVGEAHQVVLTFLQGKVAALEKELAGLESEAAGLRDDIAQTPRLTEEEVMHQAFLDVRDYQKTTQLKIHAYVERGKQLLDAGNLLEAQAFFEKAILFMNYHHSHAYLEDQLAKAGDLANAGDYEGAEAIYETILGMDVEATPQNHLTIRDQAKETLKVVAKTEKELGEAAKKWMQIDEKLKNAEKKGQIDLTGKAPVIATKEILRQTDGFFYGAIRLLEVTRTEKFKPGSKQERQFNDLIQELTKLRQELSSAKEGEDISGILLKTEALFDNASKALNRFSLRVAGLNVAFSFVRGAIAGTIGPVLGGTISLPDAKAKPREIIRELTLSMDIFRMAVGSEARYQSELEGGFEKLAKERADRLLAKRAEVAGKQGRLETVSAEIAKQQEALKLAQAELAGAESRNAAIQQEVVALQTKADAAETRVVTGAQKLGADIVVLEETIDRAEKGQEALARTEARATESAEVMAQDIAARTLTLQEFETVVHDTLGTAGPDMIPLYDMILGRLQTYEAKEKASGMTHQDLVGVGGPLFHPKRFVELLQFWKNPIGAVGLGLTLFVGNEIKYLPLFDNELLSNLYGTHNVQYADGAVGVGMSPVEFLRDIDKSKGDYYRFGITLTHKFGSEDKTVKAFEYLTDQEAAFILTMVIGPERASQVIASIEHSVDQEVVLAAGQSDLEQRIADQKKLEQFLGDLSGQVDRSEARLDDLKEKLELLQKRAEEINRAAEKDKAEQKSPGTFKAPEPLQVPEPGKEPSDSGAVGTIIPTDQHKVPEKVKAGTRAFWALGLGTAALLLAAGIRRFRDWRKIEKDQEAFEKGLPETGVSRDGGNAVIDEMPAGIGSRQLSAKDGGMRLSPEDVAKASYLADYNTPYSQIFSGMRKLRPAKRQSTWRPVLEMQKKWSKPFVTVSDTLAKESKMVESEPIQKAGVGRSLARSVLGVGKLVGFLGITTLVALNVGLQPFFLGLIGAVAGAMFAERAAAKTDKEGKGRRIFSGIMASTVVLSSAYFAASYLLNGIGLDVGTILGTLFRALPFLVTLQQAITQGRIAAKDKASYNQTPQHTSERAIEMARQFAREEMGRALEDLPAEDVKNLVEVYLLQLAVQEADVARTTDGTSSMVGKNALLEAVTDLREGEHLKAVLPGIHALPMKPQRELVFSGWGWGIPVQKFLQMVMYFASMAARKLQTVLHPFSNTKATLNKYFVISKQEQDVRNFMFLVEGRWLLGHLFVMRKELVGGKPTLRLSLYRQKYNEKYRTSRAMTEVLEGRGDTESRVAARYRSFPQMQSAWVEMGERETARGVYTIPLSSQELLQLGEGFLETEGVVAFSFFPHRGDLSTFRILTPYSVDIRTDGGKVVGITPNKKGTEFVITKPTATAKGGHVQVAFDLARGDRWFEPVVEDGRVTIRETGLEERAYGNDIREAKRAVKEDSREAAEDLKRIIERRSGFYTVAVADPHTGGVIEESLSNAPLGFRPHEGFRGVLAKVKAQTLGRVIGMLPVSFYEFTQDILVAAVMAHYDPRTVDALVGKMIDLDQKTLRELSAGLEKTAEFRGMESDGTARQAEYVVNTNVAWKEMDIEGALLKRGILLPFDLVSADQVDDNMDGLSDYLITLHQAAMSAQRGGGIEGFSERDKLLNQGMAILKAREYLKVLSQEAKTEKLSKILSYMSVKVGHRGDEKHFYRAGDQMFSESTSYQLALLRNIEGNHKALESDIAGGLYNLSHDVGVFRGGVAERPFSVPEREPWQRRAERISDIVRTRSWTYTSETGARTGGIQQEAETYSPASNASIQRLVTEARRQGYVIDKVSVDGNTIRIFTPKRNFKNTLMNGAKANLLVSRYGLMDVVKFLGFIPYRTLKALAQAVAAPFFFVGDIAQLGKPSVRMKQGFARLFDRPDRWFAQGYPKSEEVGEAYRSILGVLRGMKEETPEAMLEAEKEIRHILSGVADQTAVNAIQGLFSDSGLLGLTKGVFGDSVNVEVLGTHWYGDSAIQASLRQNGAVERIEPLQKFLVDRNGAPAGKNVNTYYSEMSRMKPSLEDREAFMAGEGTKIAVHLRELGRRAKQDPKFGAQLVTAINEHLAEKRLHFGGNAEIMPDVTLKDVQNLAKLSDHLVDSGKLRLSSQLWKWLDRGLYRLGTLTGWAVFSAVLATVAVSIASGIATLIVGIGGGTLAPFGLEIPHSIILGGIGLAAGALATRLVERFVADKFVPYSSDAKILAKIYGVTPHQLDGLWDQANWPVAMGLPTLTGKLRGRLNFFRSRGTLVDAPEVNLLGTLLAMGEPPWSAVLSGFNILPTDASDLGLILAEDTLFGLVNNFVTEYDPGVPADSLQKMKALFAGREDREDDGSILRAAQMTKGLGINYSLQNTFKHPLFGYTSEAVSADDVADYRAFLEDWVSLDERDEVSTGGARGAGFLSFILGGSTWNRHFGKRVGSLAPGARKAGQVYRMMLALDDKWGGAITDAQRQLGNASGLVGVDYQVLAAYARAAQQPQTAQDGGVRTLQQKMREDIDAGGGLQDPDTRTLEQYAAAPYLFATLVGGRGTRFQQEIPKAVYPVGDTPLAMLSIQAAKNLGMPVVAVVGDQADRVMAALGTEQVDRYVRSPDIGAGTGYGAFQIERALPQGFEGSIILIPGDVIVTQQALEKLMKAHDKTKPALTLLTAEADNPDGKGRIVRRIDGSVALVVEQSDIDNMIRAAGGEVVRDAITQQLLDVRWPEEKDPAELSGIAGATIALDDGTVLTGRMLHAAKEINLGIYAADAKELFQHLAMVRNDKRPSEWHATDVIITMNARGQRVHAVPVREPGDLRKLSGANNVPELAGIISEYLEEHLTADEVSQMNKALNKKFAKDENGAVLEALNRVLIAARTYVNYPTREPSHTFHESFADAVRSAAEASDTPANFESNLIRELDAVFIRTNGSAVRDGADRTIEMMTGAETYEASIARSLALQTGLDASLFIEKIKLLNPETRNLVGAISDKVIVPEGLRQAIKSESVTSDDFLKLYALLAHYFKGKEVSEIRLPENFNVKQLQDVDFIDLGTIDKNTFQDIMSLVFTVGQLENLGVQLESQAFEAAIATGL